MVWYGMNFKLGINFIGVGRTVRIFTGSLTSWSTWQFRCYCLTYRLWDPGVPECVCPVVENCAWVEASPHTGDCRDGALVTVFTGLTSVSLDWWKSGQRNYGDLPLGQPAGNLDGWVAMSLYPALQTKAARQGSTGRSGQGGRPGQGRDSRAGSQPLYQRTGESWHCTACPPPTPHCTAQYAPFLEATFTSCTGCRSMAHISWVRCALLAKNRAFLSPIRPQG